MEPGDTRPSNGDDDEIACLEPGEVLERLLGALGAFVLVLDVSRSRLTYVSPHVEEILGYSARQLLDDPELLRRAVHPDDEARVSRALGALQRGEVEQRMELRLIAPEGRDLWVEVALSVVREDGRARHVVGVVADVTHQKRLEQVLREQLEERVRERTARQAARLARSLAERDRLDKERRSSEARFDAFAANAIESIVIAGDDGKIAMVNARAEALVGRTAAELVGQPLTILMPPRYHEAHRRGFARYLETGEGRLMGRTVELFALRADGTEVPVELSLSSFRTAHGRTEFIGLLRDITDRKNAEAALRRTNEELHAARVQAEAATRAKSEFLAHMSHDIRTPMNGILGMTELLSYTELSPRQREYVEMTRASAESLLHLLNDILDVSKIEAGKLELVPTELSLHDAMADMLRPFAVQAAGKNLELAYHVAPDVPEVLVGDADRLRQVVSNLVSNAVKFTDRGEVVVNVEVTLRTPDAVVLHVTVRDTGIGIEPSQQQRIFEAFRQVAGRGGRPGGTGLGLTIAARIVALMDGRIWVESEPGVGSTFHFTVRLGIGEQRERRARKVESLVGLRVLVVDDNAVNRLMLEENLSRWEARPIAVSSGQEAIDALDGAAREETPFGLILLDARLPGASGLEIAGAIRQRRAYADTPIVMLSSSSEPLDAEEQRAHRIARVLVKPVRRSQLLDAIVEALGIGAAPPAPRGEAPRTVRPMRVLVVDDNPINQRIAAELLRRRGHEVKTASDGRRALELLESERFDCVLMDVEMPVMDGLEATRALRAREGGTGAHMPVIAMTAYAMKGDRERMLGAGMDGYVAKPARPAELYTAVERYGATAREERDAAPAPPAVDLDAALSRAGGERELLSELAAMFVEQRPALLGEIREAVDAKDGPRLRRAAHTLKGSVALFGAREAARLAADLERMGIDGSFGAGAERLAALEGELARVERDLGAASLTRE